ncbi:hypothetical protein LPB67_16165 [Undibacterium sp. Jales W-56]|uniref:hypothetical protein n=1 Tax=Undibacterium sp. Jales W-56 TaxID=2897325 RepID=UPI0021D0D421|nr:hypothetical protein [Undibacterium sp. Jales W-56]MCU6435312.1 hypothetical protein [Undibacterium sp. Jales W-56]
MRQPAFEDDWTRIGFLGAATPRDVARTTASKNFSISLVSPLKPSIAFSIASSLRGCLYLAENPYQIDIIA